MIKTLYHILTTLTKVRKHTVSQKRSPLSYAAKRICLNCRKPGHIARDRRANKAFFSQNQQKVHSQRFNIQQTINPNFTSSQPQYKHSSSQSDTRHNDVQKQRPGKNQCSSSQTNLIFTQQHDFRSPEFQTNGSNSSQDSFQSKTSNRSTKKTRLNMAQSNFR